MIKMATVLVEQEKSKQDQSLDSKIQDFLIGRILIQGSENAAKYTFGIEEEGIKKPSEICYEAARNSVKHIKGNYARDGGYCIMGLLTKNGVEFTEFAKYEEHYMSQLVTDNDSIGLDWEQFGDRFAAIGL